MKIDSVDVDADQDLVDRFGGRVPVLISRRGRVVAEGRISRSDAWRAVLRARIGV